MPRRGSSVPDEAYCTIQVGGHHVDSKRYDALVDNADAEAVRKGIRKP